MAKKSKKQSRVSIHLKSLGFTNRLCIYSLLFLLVSIVLGFILAVLSIRADANFTLAAYTCSVAPIGTFISVAIGKAIDKSKSENCSSGIVFETAMANLAAQNNTNANQSFDEGNSIPEDFMIMPDDEDLSGDTTI